MTDTEFDEWLEGYKRAYPETAVWLNGLDATKTGEKTTRKDDMLRTWKFALADIGKDEARKVTAEMVLGNSPSVPGFERERTATIVRQNALEARRRDYKPEPDQEPIPSAATLNGGVSLAGLLRQMTDIDGLTAEQKAEMLARAFPAASRDKRDWHKCKLCRDTGKLDVWHPDYVLKVMEHGLGKVKTRYSSVCACTCGEGYPFRTRKTNPLVEFTPLNHCLCLFGDVTDMKNLEELLDWIQNRKERFVKERGDPLLAAYNTEEF